MRQDWLASAVAPEARVPRVPRDPGEAANPGVHPGGSGWGAYHACPDPDAIGAVAPSSQACVGASNTGAMVSRTRAW